MAMTKVKALQMWCKKMAEGYRDVEVRDMAASWKSGLAFCAIIHRFRPDLIDYDSLSKENVFENNDLAFEVAEKQLNIPAFLEAADMVAIRVPDKLSVVTYVSQYYNYFHDKPQLGGPGVSKAVSPGKKPAAASTSENKSLTPARTNPDNTPVTKLKKERQESIGDKCSMCHEKVYLLERHIENAKLYHRSCFRKSEMSPTSKVFKKHPHSPIAEEKKDFVTSKHRKLDNDPPGTSGVQLDFWQRRAQAKKQEKQNDNKFGADLKPSEAGKSKSDTSVGKTKEPEQDVPAWKRGLEKKEERNASANTVSPVFGNKSASETKDNKPKSANITDKFKELNERNLKQLNGKEGEKTNVTTKLDSNASQPKPKPRHNIASKFEKMDTSETEPALSGPKPVPRFQKADNQSPKATPRHLEVKSKSPPPVRHTGFSRPKTPPQRPKSEFSLNLSSVSTATVNDESPSSPPPLPCSTPPKLPPSQPPKMPSSTAPKFDLGVHSPKSSPRDIGIKSSAGVNSHKQFGGTPDPPRNTDFKSKVGASVEKPALKNINVPSKPPRASAVVESNRSSSPMETCEAHEAPKSRVKESHGGHSAVLVVPNRPKDEQKNKEVFGGLLKSLANVRNKNDADVNSASSDSGKPSEVTKPFSDKNDNKPTETKHKFEKRTGGKIEEKNKVQPKMPQRPKSSFVSQNTSLLEPERHEAKPAMKVVKTTKTTTTTTVVTTNDKHGETSKTDKTKEVSHSKQDDDIPEWKRKLEERKKERSRPKSADILNEQNNTEGLLDWQKEAAKRKEARKGGYVDPEKPNVTEKSAIGSASKDSHDVNQNSATANISRPTSPPQRKIQDKNLPPKVDTSKSPERKKINVNGAMFYDTDKPTVETQKKKIPVDTKFKFDVIEPKSGPKKPPRPPTSPPRSPKSHPARPPPYRAVSNFQPAKHHISAHQIQRQLQLIDSKLTQLELKGRTLEDAIRNGKDEEEDDLMISWFQLVNEKNDLVRRECDYIYINRQQELELQQHHIDQQLRDLVDIPDTEKTDADTLEEEQLMERLIDVVNQRSKIVDSIDEDRLRYLDEDSHIEAMLQQKDMPSENH